MKPSGFTLIETMIAITLLALCGAIVLPLASQYSARLSVMHAADEFTSTISLARALALRSSDVAQLQIDDALDRFWVEVDTAGSGQADTIGRVIDLSENAVSLSSTRSLLCFDATGIATTINGCPSADAVVIFSRNEWADTVELSVAGKVLR